MSSKARKELSNLLRAIEDYHENANEYIGKTIIDVLGQHINAAYRALADPIRNCDVGTAEEQKGRHDSYCTFECPKCLHKDNNVYANKCIECFARWAQMPYKEGK
jgi:hypothetical protein